MYLITCEADDRRLAGRAVDTNVRNLTLPSVEMRLECFPTWEGMTGDRVLLHIADAVLRLALRARPIWRAGARTEAPMFHSLSPQLSEEGAIPRDAEGAVFQGAR